MMAICVCVHPPIFRQTHILIILIKSPLNHHSITILDHFCPVTVGGGAVKLIDGIFKSQWSQYLRMYFETQNIWNLSENMSDASYCTRDFSCCSRLVPTSSSTTHAIPCSWHRFHRMCFSGIYIPTGITKAYQDVSNNICICIYTLKNTI